MQHSDASSCKLARKQNGWKQFSLEQTAAPDTELDPFYRGVVKIWRHSGALMGSRKRHQDRRTAQPASRARECDELISPARLGRSRAADGVCFLEVVGLAAVLWVLVLHVLQLSLVRLDVVL